MQGRRAGKKENSEPVGDRFHEWMGLESGVGEAAGQTVFPDLHVGHYRLDDIWISIS